MLGAVVFAVCSAQATPPKVTYQAGTFQVSGALGTESVPVSGLGSLPGGPEKKIDQFKLTVDGKTVSFDAKGLSLAGKGAPAVSRLNAVPTSGKIATKESNAELMKLVSSGKRSLNVSALSGWEQVGKTLYLLVRWDGSDKKPWLETLMKVDLAEANPKAQFVGRFSGFSFAQGTIVDVLTLRSDKLSVLANSGDEFGISRIALKGSEATFEPLGQAVGKAKFSDDGSMAWTLSPTPYGTNILGIADLDYGSYHVVTEVRGQMTGILTPAYARFKAPDGLKMINLMTGAVIGVQADSAQRQTTNGLLLWSPIKNPRQAFLYDPSFRRLAVWSAPPPTAPAVKVAVKKANVPTNLKTDSSLVKMSMVKKPVVKGKAPAKKWVVGKQPLAAVKPPKKAATNKPSVSIKVTKSAVKKPAASKAKAKTVKKPITAPQG